jgi:hypothetical protein
VQPAAVSSSSSGISEVVLRQNHRVIAVASAPFHSFIAAVCDRRLFILSTDASRFEAVGPTMITRPVKKCCQAIAFDEECLYYLVEGKDKIYRIFLQALSDSTATLTPDSADGKVSRVFDVDPIVVSTPCVFHGVAVQLHQLSITSLAASCSVLAITHSKGFLVVDFKRSTVPNIIHKADHDGSIPSILAMMPGGAIAVANHPSIYRERKDESLEDCIIFMQPPRVLDDVDSSHDLLRSHQISCVRYTGTGCSIKGMAAVGHLMFVLLGSKEALPNSAHIKGGCFLDICVPSSGISLRHYREHRGIDYGKRLQDLTDSVPGIHKRALSWIVSTGASIACIFNSSATDISLFDVNPAFFQSILDSHWFEEAKRQALPSLNRTTGTCDWDRLDIDKSELKENWWLTLCFHSRRPHKLELHRLPHLRSLAHLNIPADEESYADFSCFRTVCRNVWELVLMEDETEELRKQRCATSITASAASSASETMPDTKSRIDSSLPVNPWEALVSSCAHVSTKSFDEHKSDFEKLDLAFGRSTPSLKPGCVKPASDEERSQKAREIMISGMNKKSKIGLALNDVSCGPCSRFFQMHICLNKITLSQTIGVDLLPLTMFCCLYSPNGSRLTPNYEIDRQPSELRPFDGSCVFADVVGSDVKNQDAPRFVIAVFRLFCHFRGDKHTTGKSYLETAGQRDTAERTSEINIEKVAIDKERVALGHMLQPLAWSFAILPLDTNDFKDFSWPDWATQDEKTLFISHLTSKGAQASSAPWTFEAERGFCAPVYRLNNKPLTDQDIKNLVHNLPPRRDRLTQSTLLSFAALKGHLALPSALPAAPCPAFFHSLPEDIRYHQLNHRFPASYIYPAHHSHNASR